MTRTHVLKNFMSRRQREDLADAVGRSLAGGREFVFVCCTVDACLRPLPGLGLDLVVRAATSDEAFNAWERHAEAVGAEGRHRVCLTWTPPAEDGEREEEVETIRWIDLDMLSLMDDLAVLDDEDASLGMPVSATICM